MGYTWVTHFKQKDTTAEEVEGGEYVSSKSAKDFLLAGSFCAVAADKNSTDTMWFIIINSEESTSKNNESDDYGFCIAAGQPYLKGQFLEKVGNCRAGLKFKVETSLKKMLYTHS